jgi:hypothetical protein
MAEINDADFYGRDVSRWEVAGKSPLPPPGLTFAPDLAVMLSGHIYFTVSPHARGAREWGFIGRAVQHQGGHSQRQD